MSADQKYRFPDCMHALAAAMHIEGIDPHAMVISLPERQWWDLWCALDRKYHHLMTYSGRGLEPEQFQYMGFTFRPLADKAQSR